MNLEYPDREAPRGTFFDVIFAIIVLLASGFSAFTTYLGFSQDLPLYMSIPIAAIIGLGLLAINFKIRSARIGHDGLAAPFLVFLIVFAFSFVSNTNAFYSRLIQDDIVRETQDEAWLLFERESAKALKLIDEHPPYQAELKLIAEVENEITKLKDQITDPRNPGLGERAQQHLRRIEELLETTPTSLVPPPPEAAIRRHEQYAGSLEGHIRKLIEEREEKGVVNAFLGLHKQIRNTRKIHQQHVADRDYRRTHTDAMRRDLEWIESETNRWLSPSPPLQLEEVNDKADEIGKFKYTWRNFVEMVSPVAIVLSVVLGALLDILAPALSLAFYRPRYD